MGAHIQLGTGVLRAGPVPAGLLGRAERPAAIARPAPPSAAPDLAGALVAWLLSSLLSLVQAPMRAVWPAIDVEPVKMAIRMLLRVGPLALGIAYAVGFVLLFRKPAWSRRLAFLLLRWGAMALTNYLTQSLIGIALFYGIGLGLGPAHGMAVVLLAWALVLALQIAWSHWWLERFRYVRSNGCGDGSHTESGHGCCVARSRKWIRCIDRIGLASSAVGCGSKENTNGVLRRYFPKGMDLSPISQAKLDAVARELNGRPRKMLGHETPDARFRQTVASTR
ncbi:DUF418 domain-containing protein [Serratia marcescens]|uniref:DUF418 domain-containing protein n=1 Tax=Serratia marcescens TaxID=615 RepID=A0A939NMB0_SERMA|nr:DUF418 domain-containing protein [Serratia marcescens]